MEPVKIIRQRYGADDNDNRTSLYLCRDYSERVSLSRTYTSIKLPEIVDDCLIKEGTRFRATNGYTACYWRSKITNKRYMVYQADNSAVECDILTEVKQTEVTVSRNEQPSFFVKSNGINAQDTQRADCAVRALSIAFNAEYDYIYYMLKDKGRADNKGTAQHHSNKSIDELCSILGFKATYFNLKQLGIDIRVDEFLQTYNTGRYICYVPKHVFTVIDGKRHDTYLANERVLLGVKIDGDFSKKIMFEAPVVKDIEFHFDI